MEVDGGFFTVKLAEEPMPVDPRWMVNFLGLTGERKSGLNCIPEMERADAEISLQHEVQDENDNIRVKARMQQQEGGQTGKSVVVSQMKLSEGKNKGVEWKKRVNSYFSNKIDKGKATYCRKLKVRPCWSKLGNAKLAIDKRKEVSGEVGRDSETTSSSSGFSFSNGPSCKILFHKGECSKKQSGSGLVPENAQEEVQKEVIKAQHRVHFPDDSGLNQCSYSGSQRDSYGSKVDPHSGSEAGEVRSEEDEAYNLPGFELSVVLQAERNRLF